MWWLRKADERLILLEGDGEISFCGAIEIAGEITIKFEVIKDGQKKLGMNGGKSPIYIPGPVQPQFSPGRMIYFEGFSVDEHGKQHYLDTTVAYRQSCLRVIEYLKRFGYDDYQIYLMLSCIPIEGHVAGIVDVSDLKNESTCQWACEKLLLNTG
jgi:formamidase